MWYSSGGIRSSLHFDNVELVVCEYRGNETYTMFDKYKHKVFYSGFRYFELSLMTLSVPHMVLFSYIVSADNTNVYSNVSIKYPYKLKTPGGVFSCRFSVLINILDF